MRHLSRTISLFGIGVAALAIAMAACSDSIEQAEPADQDAVVSDATVAPPAEGVAASASEGPEPAPCPPGSNVVDPVRDVVEWVPGEDGRQLVRLWRFRTVKTYSADECGDAPAGSFLRARTGQRLVWERTWPDDFREVAARRGWPADLIDRCDIGSVQTVADAYVRGACQDLEEELFYSAEDALPAGVRRLPAAGFLVRAVDLGYDIDEIIRCRDQLYDYSDPAAPASACLAMMREAEQAVEDAAAARDVYNIRCPSGGSDEKLAFTYTVWGRDEEGQRMVQLWHHPAIPVEGAVCDAADETSTIAVRFDSDGHQMLWEKAWPDDFRADAVELGWPAGMIDRCGSRELDTSSDPVLHRMCSAMRTELFHETPEAIALAAEETRLNPDLRVVRPLNDGWGAEQLAACKEALFEALPRGITPRVCRADSAAAAALR